MYRLIRAFAAGTGWHGLEGSAPPPELRTYAPGIGTTLVLLAATKVLHLVGSGQSLAPPSSRPAPAIPGTWRAGEPGVRAEGGWLWFGCPPVRRTVAKT
jgi:hypothetical protein